MRGYLSFLLVLASASLILSLIEASEAPSKISFSRAIAAERAYQAQMNAKEMALEAIRDGGVRYFQEYNLTHPPGCKDPQLPCHFRMDEAALAAKTGSYLYAAQLRPDAFSPGMDVRISCGRGMTRDIADSLARGGGCPGCEAYDPAVGNATGVREIIGGGGTPGCFGAVLPWIEAAGPDTNPALRRFVLLQDLVITVSYPAFNVTAASYIPAGYEVGA